MDVLRHALDIHRLRVKSEKRKKKCVTQRNIRTQYNDAINGNRKKNSNWLTIVDSRASIYLNRSYKHRPENWFCDRKQKLFWRPFMNSSIWSEKLTKPFKVVLFGDFWLMFWIVWIIRFNWAVICFVLVLIFDIGHLINYKVSIGYISRSTNFHTFLHNTW